MKRKLQDQPLPEQQDPKQKRAMDLLNQLRTLRQAAVANDAVADDAVADDAVADDAVADDAVAHGAVAAVADVQKWRAVYDLCRKIENLHLENAISPSKEQKIEMLLIEAEAMHILPEFEEFHLKDIYRQILDIDETNPEALKKLAELQPNKDLESSEDMEQEIRPPGP